MGQKEAQSRCFIPTNSTIGGEKHQQGSAGAVSGEPWPCSLFLPNPQLMWATPALSKMLVILWMVHFKRHHKQQSEVLILITVTY